ncbi:MAG: DNA-processing protein DprA [Deltaproteobacteria bacterium]|nr:DNA-processing protein DprA [Deltaproteobacteria bacterium]
MCRIMDVYTLKKSEPFFPDRWRKLSDAPSEIRVWGNLPVCSLVAIVGTRNADARMMRFTEDLCSNLVRHDFGIVSGGALGIDTAAHRGALEGGGRTIAVLGSGFEHIFPQKNRGLFEKIAENGAVISELPDCTPPTKWTFPRRNRLVAAMASAVVVVQAPIRSGSMITARIAKEIGVPVGAVPGGPTEYLASGCNQLIRGGATLVTGAEDVLKMTESDSYCQQLDLPGTVKQVMESTKKAPAGLSSVEQRIWDQLSLDSIHIDDIALRTKLPVHEVNAAVLNLELSGLIEDLGGRRFVRT